MAKKQKILQPQYVKEFRCIGGDCEDICCVGDWQINIDKATYQLYKKCPDLKLRQKLDKKITRNRVNPDNNNYAKIKMDNDKSCPFLDEEKLCSIQRSVGERYLSDICAIYPRNYNLVDGVLEKSITISCPEATRLVLLNKNLMEFDMTEEDVSVHKAIINTLETDEAKKKNKYEQYFSELRIFTISLLQNRLYPLWQRLVILGLFCKNLDNLIAENKTDEILPLIAAYFEHLQEGVFHESLQGIPNKLNVQIEIIKEIAVNRALKSGDKCFFQCFAEAMQGINYSEELPPEELSAQYDLVCKNYYQPIASKHEYILENYLTNYVFATLFPIKSEKRVFDNYSVLVVHYALIKTLLIGMAGFHKEEFNTRHMLTLIHSLTKSITHNPLFLKSVVDFLKDNNADNMPYMSILIKN